MVGVNGWILSLLSLTIGSLLTAFLSKRNENLLKIADKKSNYYAEYISALLKFENTNEEINRNYFYYKNMIILYGSDDVIEKLAVCERIGINTNSEEGRIIYTDLIKAMKKDIERPRLLKTFWRSKHTVFERDEYINTILFNYKKKNV